MYKYIYNIGSKYRNPSLEDYINFHSKAYSWDISRVKKFQLKKLKELLIFSNDYSEFWSEFFKKNNIKIHSVDSLNVLNDIPFLEKSDLLNYNSKIHTKYNFKRKFFGETSGTSGEALTLWRDEEWDSFNRAFMINCYAMHNVNIWERNGYLWGYNINKRDAIKVQILDSIQNRFRIFSYNEDEILKFANLLKKSVFLHGYSSMIYEIAKLVNEYGIEISNLRMVKGTSEKIFDKYQIESNAAFKNKIISEYGAAETGVIGFECPYENTHINMLGVIVQEIEGEIVVTNLMSKSFPIIRYKLGDYISIGDSISCPCGSEAPIIKDILGRVGKSILGKLNKYPSLTFYYIFKNLAVKNGLTLNYQVIQEKKVLLIF